MFENGELYQGFRLQYGLVKPKHCLLGEPTRMAEYRTFIYTMCCPCELFITIQKSLSDGSCLMLNHWSCSQMSTMRSKVYQY